MRTVREVAVFVTRRGGQDVLLVHRSPGHGSYWHVVAGGIELGETPVEAAERELREETGLVARLAGGMAVSEYVDVRTEEPADEQRRRDPFVACVDVTCFRAAAPDGWEPRLDWEHDTHRWCDARDASGALRWKGTARALRALLGVTD